MGVTFVLTDQETAEVLRKQEIVSKLNACGALSVRGGSVTLHFDGDGTLRRVDKTEPLLRV